MVNLILSKYVITNQIAQRADDYKVMYVTLPINSDWIGDIHTVFSDLLLMLHREYQVYVFWYQVYQARPENA